MIQLEQKEKKPSEKDKVKGIKEVIDKLEVPEYSLYKQDIARSTWISKMSEEFHTSTIYGYLDVEASKTFNKRDAQILSDYASEVRRICDGIVNAARTGHIKIVGRKLLSVRPSMSPMMRSGRTSLPS